MLEISSEARESEFSASMCFYLVRFYLVRFYLVQLHLLYLENPGVCNPDQPIPISLKVIPIYIVLVLDVLLHPIFKSV